MLQIVAGIAYYNNYWAGFISRANTFARVLFLQRRTGQHSKVMMLTTLYLWNENNYRDVVCTIG